VSELGDRLEALANRGTHRGADDVLGAAQRDAQSIPSESGAGDFDDSEMTIIDDELPVVTLEPRTRQRRRYGSLIASVGIAALIGVGALAVTALFGSGGASSPEGAVRQLADAVSNKDPLAAVDVLVPSEVRSMRDTVKNVTNRAADLKIVDEASQPLAGIDLSVDHLELRTEPLADGYAKVVITSGDLNASTHKAQLSALLQKAMRDNADGHSQADLSKLTGDSGLPTFVVVIKEDGGWYVSPAYTALEYIRELNDYPAADFGSAKTADVGAATPEAAVQDALHAWQSSNWDRLMALAPPDELPVYDYRAMIDAAATDTKADFTIDHLSTTSTVSGDTGIVKLDASGSTGGGGHWQVGGTCASYVEQARASSDGEWNLCLSGDLGGSLPFGFVYAGGLNSDATSGPISISVVRENGRWFVSPVTTVLGAVDAAVRNIDQRTVYTLFGLAYALPPDGTITLDQPFDVPAPSGTLLNRVYAFDGKAGQELVGQIAGPVPTSTDASYSDYVYGMIYTADGKQYGSVDFQHVPTPGKPVGGSVYVSSVRLPVNGSYRLVLEPYAGGSASSARTVTLWDVADAPSALRDASHPQDLSDGSDCGSPSGGLFLGGSVECKSSIAIAPSTGTVTPTTFGGSAYVYGGKSSTATSIAYPPTTTIAPVAGNSSR
jgi:hypothetical protein